jgi:CRISPR-associated protein Cas5
MTLDLNFLLEPPDFSARALLKIDALAPLSMVASLPGKYYHSQPEPTDAMLYGMLENALGWHVSTKERKDLSKKLRQKFGEPEKTGVGFVSLLQFHLRFTTRALPPLLHYDDLWAQHLKHNDDRHIDGSRNYDFRAIPFLNERRLAKANKQPSHVSPADVIKFFPQYYASPTMREYIIPKGVYQFVAETSLKISEMIANALRNPAAPLYLGSNDGWIEADWEVLQPSKV